MTTQNVTDKILADAKKENQDILKRYRQEVKLLKEKNDKQISSRREIIEEDAESLRETEMLRTISQKKLEFNRDLTAQKQEIIKRIISEALTKLADHKKYLTFLETLIKQSGEKQGTLLINQRDWHKYGSALKEFLKKNKLDFTVEINENITGGMIIKKEKTTYHGSLDLISELLYDEFAIAISNTLFGN